MITLDIAMNVLMADLVRLKTMSFFAQRFKTVAHDENVDIAGKSLMTQYTLSFPLTEVLSQIFLSLTRL